MRVPTFRVSLLWQILCISLMLGAAIWIEAIRVDDDVDEDYQDEKYSSESVKKGTDRTNAEPFGRRNQCGQIPADPHKQDAKAFRIFWGHQAKFAGEWPFAVKIYTCQFSVFEGCIAVCSGTVINEEWILTAGHCTKYHDDPSHYHVMVGMYDDNETKGPANKEAFLVNVSKIVTHEEYNGTALENDIGLLKLAKPVEYSNYYQQVCPLLDENIADLARAGPCYSVGYGRTHYRIAGKLHYYPFEYPLNQTYCKSEIPSNASHTICLKSIGPEIWTNSCQGDSGGPAICYDRKRASWLLVGIVSHGPGPCSVVRMTNYVDTRYYLQWIKDKVNGFRAPERKKLRS